MTDDPVVTEWERELARVERRQRIVCGLGVAFLVLFVPLVMVLSYTARVEILRWQLGLP